MDDALKFLSIVNLENISILLGLAFMLCLLAGITDLQRNIEKIGD